MLEINKIYNEDFLKNTIPDNSIDLIVTDPPYKVTSRGRGKEGTTTSGGMLEDKLTCKGKIFKHNDIKPQQYIPEFYRVLKEGSHCYIMTNHINLLEILTVANECGLHFIKSIIWDKGNKIMSQLYMSQFEYILFFRKGKSKRINNCGTSDLISIPNKKTKGEDGNNIHDTEKPIELMKILIENSSQEGEIVLDPFIGVGSVALACVGSSRDYIGYEIDEDYCGVANKRLKL
ncbi:MAG TPA: hypothetical protein DEG71_02450 [Clostridiales bacterium]|nr:hypothetical protein [Clostridiales bacterium]